MTAVASKTTSPAAVRTMRADEFAATQRVAMEAFGNDPVIGALVATLRSSQAWIDELSFVADIDGEIVGQVLFTRAWLDAPERLVDVLVLSPVGVVPRMHGRGIGSQLIRHGLGVLDQRTEPLVFLEGHPNFYPRFGFSTGREQGFIRPSARIPHPAFMARRLPTFEPWMTGALVYPDAFWQHDAVGLRPGADAH